jgi:hypothetical protein
MKIGICVPTNRIDAVSVFAQEWESVFRYAADQALFLSLFIHEDAPKRTEIRRISSVGECSHTCHQDIEAVLGERNWIIPRNSGACRSFPMYLAWKERCDYIVTLDDDCYPGEIEPEQFFTSHLAAFKRDRWFRTIDGVKPRGVPYGDCGSLTVILNHGVWTGISDLDGPTSLVVEGSSSHVILRADREVIPPGMFFPLCAMNVCYHRSAIPAAYNLLMGLDGYGFDRFDDIWSGLFLKKISDHLGLYITSGIPIVRHAKASNPFSNNRKEALGIHLHEFFWRHIAAANLAASDINGCYHELGDWVKEFPKSYPKAPDCRDYFERLGDAMHTWQTLFE